MFSGDVCTMLLKSKRELYIAKFGKIIPILYKNENILDSISLS